MQEAGSLLLISGLEAVGKSDVIADGLAQSGLKTVRLPCVLGTSADFQFEFLIRSAGRVHPSVAPRREFPVRDIADALASAKVLWSEDAHHLIERGRWRSSQLGVFFQALLDALKITPGARLIVESRIRVELHSELGQRILRRAVRGLDVSDATKLFERELQGVELAAAMAAFSACDTGGTSRSCRAKAKR